MTKLLLLFLFTSTYCLAEGKFFKWTDEKGVIHYSETKPEQNSSSEITLQTSKPTALKATNETREQEERKETTTNQLKKYAAQDKQRRDRDQQKRQRCRNAKKSMKKLKSSMTPYLIDPKSGGRIYPSSRTAAKIKARQQERIRKKQIQVNAACKKWTKK